MNIFIRPRLFLAFFYLHNSKISCILTKTIEVNMTDVTALVLGILVVLIIPAIYLSKKAKEAQEKEHKKELALTRKHRNRRRNKKK